MSRYCKLAIPFLQMPAFRPARSRRRRGCGPKTVEQVAAEIKEIDEFIIDPKSPLRSIGVATRYSVMGNVAAPGVPFMDRKVSVLRSDPRCRGVSKTGDKKKVASLSAMARTDA